MFLKVKSYWKCQTFHCFVFYCYYYIQRCTIKLNKSSTLPWKVFYFEKLFITLNKNILKENCTQIWLKFIQFSNIKCKKLHYKIKNGAHNAPVATLANILIFLFTYKQNNQIKTFKTFKSFLISNFSW